MLIIKNTVNLQSYKFGNFSIKIIKNSPVGGCANQISLRCFRKIALLSPFDWNYTHKGV